ncbi:MAG: hypothetical protein VW397_06090 [Candidatus Margulisiibacteriota bacterium]
MTIEKINNSNHFKLSNKRNDQPTIAKKQGVELLTLENIQKLPYECRPGECAPINGGKCYPDH